MSSEQDSPDIEIPDLPLEEFEVPEQRVDTIENDVHGSVNYGFVGAGQCGSRLAEAFYKIGYRKSVVINTSPQDLTYISLPSSQKYHMQGFEGAGKSMNVGDGAVRRYEQEIFNLIRRVMGDSVQHLMVSSGFGGGTGGGGFGRLVQICKKYMKRVGVDHPQKHVGAVVTLPRRGELQGIVCSNVIRAFGQAGAMAVAEQISPLVIIDNAKVDQLYHNIPVSKFWSTINATVAGLLDIFNRLSKMDSPYASFDPSDYASIIDCGGCCIMGVTKVKELEDETSVSNALKQNLQKTMLAEGFDLTTAKFVGVIAVGPRQILEEKEGLQAMLDYGFDTISNLTGNATVHRGIFSDSKEHLRVYTILGGLDVPRGYAKKLGVRESTLFSDVQGEDFHDR